MTDTANWPRFRSHKVIQAAKITACVKHLGRTTYLEVVPVDGGPAESFMPTQEGMADRVGVGDYALVYPDGFRSVSPKAQFEDGYTLVEAEANG